MAPWHIFPRCYYSKVEVCETKTDCKGYFNCCFKRWPFHDRFGRLRFDARPDIIVKVTRVIDLFLDNEEVICGNGVAALYEVRNCSDDYWCNPVWIGSWLSRLNEPDTGKYLLRVRAQAVGHGARA